MSMDAKKSMGWTVVLILLGMAAMYGGSKWLSAADSRSLALCGTRPGPDFELAGIDGRGENKTMPIIALDHTDDCEDPTAGPFKLKPWNDDPQGQGPRMESSALGHLSRVLFHGSDFEPCQPEPLAPRWRRAPLYFCFSISDLFFLVNPRALAHIAGMVLLGIAFQPINGGACTFFIFAAAMVPFCVKTQRAAAIGLITIGSIGGRRRACCCTSADGSCSTRRCFRSSLAQGTRSLPSATG